MRAVRLVSVLCSPWASVQMVVAGRPVVWAAGGGDDAAGATICLAAETGHTSAITHVLPGVV